MVKGKETFSDERRLKELGLLSSAEERSGGDVLTLYEYSWAQMGKEKSSLG